jgi:hypothetical protein
LLYYGVEFSASREKNLQQRAKSGLTIWPFDERGAAEFGRIRAELRRLGRPMQVLDIMIAAVAFSLGNCTVVSADTDFSAVSGGRELGDLDGAVLVSDADKSECPFFGAQGVTPVPPVPPRRAFAPCAGPDPQIVGR